MSWFMGVGCFVRLSQGSRVMQIALSSTTRGVEGRRAHGASSYSDQTNVDFATQSLSLTTRGIEPGISLLPILHSVRLNYIALRPLFPHCTKHIPPSTQPYAHSSSESVSLLCTDSLDSTIGWLTRERVSPSHAHYLVTYDVYGEHVQVAHTHGDAVLRSYK